MSTRASAALRAGVMSLVVLGVTGVAAASDGNGHHLVLVSVDTLRADALGSYGFAHDVSPTIDALADRGTLFEDTATVIGKTGPAFATLFSGLYPPTHGARRNGMLIRPDASLLSERLGEAGYVSVAFISNWTLRDKLSGLGRGFDLYDEKFDKSRYVFGLRERTAEDVTQSALAWLEAAEIDRPLFLWAHYSDPHSPYTLQEGFEIPEPPASERSGGWQKRWRYASEVGYTDHQIGKLLSGVFERIDPEETLVVFVSDHGESFGEHGYWGHGRNTHWPNLDIPLIFAGPGVPRGKRVSAQASIVDLRSTILPLLGLDETKGVEIAGVDLFAAPDPARPRYAIGDRGTTTGTSRSAGRFKEPLEISMEAESVKVIFNFEKRRVAHYHVGDDPLELEPADEPHVDWRPSPRRRLANWYRQLKKYEHRTSTELTEEDLEQLESLGYIGAP